MAGEGRESTAIVLATAGGGLLAPEAAELLRRRRDGVLSRVELIAEARRVAAAHTGEGKGDADRRP